MKEYWALPILFFIIGLFCIATSFITMLTPFDYSAIYRSENNTEIIRTSYSHTISPIVLTPTGAIFITAGFYLKTRKR